ncbi:transmembrane protein 53 [Latimeria chalumnae]|uniref:transmembrane protein 53 n=1 Tax=Latimeria chalumnae TaxID=7897 RepID=UPI00313C64F9
MGDVELDYTIAFPNPGLTAGAVGNTWGGEKEPLVILLGWGGCTDKLLAKYGAIYLKQGCITLRYIAPWKTVFFSEALGRKKLWPVAQKVLELLFDYEVDSHPILFHVFSNGGFMLYRYIVELLHREPAFHTFRVVGSIFDSAPGDKNVLGAIQALSLILTPSTNTVLRYLILAAFAVLVLFLRILLYPATRRFNENHYDAMKKDPSRWPQLYLYSKADQVIRSRDVERMLKLRQEQGVLVEAVDFASSEHVSHFRRFPKEYSARCVGFLKDCFQRASKPQGRRILLS